MERGYAPGGKPRADFAEALQDLPSSHHNIHCHDFLPSSSDDHKSKHDLTSKFHILIGEIGDRLSNLI